ncbi:MAG TPA: Holliday junction resolvase RecU [Firmicutes bacterium]|nr:Holliday junction resolvase RecU [Bacillota bacterium]
MNYPHKKKLVSPTTSSTNFGKRGMSFEDDLQRSNDFYLANGIAVIHKKPTPVQIVKVHYPKRAAAVITEAYFRTPSTTDFNGIYKGKYIDFEAKETSNVTIFPLQNLHSHQVEHMKQVANQGGIVFLLVNFSKFNEIYLLPSEKLIDFWQQYKVGTRKSIKLEEFKTFGTLIKQGAYPRIDYLKVVDELFL